MYIENPDEEQLKSQSSSSPSVGAGGGGVAIGTGGTSTGGNPSTISPIQTNPTNQSFATVQDYLKANQPQGEEFGQQFVSTVGQGVGQAKSAIDTSSQNAQNEVTAGTVNANPGLISEALKTPALVANDAGKLAEFQKEYNAQYSGPSSFESSDQYAPAASAVNAATQTGTELGSTGGREQILQDTFGVYGQGNKGLDQTLLQNSSAYPNIPPLEKSFQSVQDYLKAASANTNAAATNAAKTTEATKTTATAPFSNSLTNFQNKVNSEVQVAQQQAQTGGSAIQNDLATGNGAALSKDLKDAGVSPENVASISEYLLALNKDYRQNPDLSNYLTSNPISDITSANVATPEEYANAAALQKLTGTNYSGVLNPANAGQAGTANTLPQVNAKDLQSYLRNNLSQRDSEMVSGKNLISSVLPILNDPKAVQDYAGTINNAISRQLTAAYSSNDPKQYQAVKQQVQALHGQILNYIREHSGDDPKIGLTLGPLAQSITQV